MSEEVMEEVHDNVKIEDRILATRRLIIAQIESEIKEHQQIITKYEDAMAISIGELNKQCALLNMEMGSLLARGPHDTVLVDSGNKLSTGDNGSHENKLNIPLSSASSISPITDTYSSHQLSGSEQKSCASPSGGSSSISSCSSSSVSSYEKPLELLSCHPKRNRSNTEHNPDGKRKRHNEAYQVDYGGSGDECDGNNSSSSGSGSSRIPSNNAIITSAVKRSSRLTNQLTPNYTEEKEKETESSSDIEQLV
jgi:hypothetical protein